ncbi:MAG: tetratricopeptide repeat protein, partial [Armatimonadetes bacterium]|nr:tetratricopeptide repeat protein [Armatimonadota bacterium]
VQAERAYRAALTTAPNSAALMNNLAYFYAEEGIKLDEALLLAERAVRLLPNDANIVDTLGWAQYKKKRYSDAARTLERAVRLKPDDPTLRYHLGATYFKLGKLWNSRIELEKALLLDREMLEAKKLLRVIRRVQERKVSLN